MSRIVFPKDGLYPHCRGDFESSIRYLTRARINCGFSVPSSFPYRDYLYNLEKELIGYCSEIKRIESRLRRIDKNFDRLSDDLSVSASRIEIPKIKKRGRMIV